VLLGICTASLLLAKAVPAALHPVPVLLAQLIRPENVQMIVIVVQGKNDGPGEFFISSLYFLLCRICSLPGSKKEKVVP
jgi:hypothetical protein